MGLFDGGFGAYCSPSCGGARKAKEIWFLCRQYDAQQALDMGLVNTVVPLEKLEAETLQMVSGDDGAVPMGFCA